MTGIAFDEKNWAVKVGAGVSAFDLQRAAVRRGYRVNVAEPAALVWLNMFRILSSRMGREKQFAVNIIYLPLEEDLIAEINAGFKRIADRHGLSNGLGFITPIDSGKRCILEYDYFFDQTDPEEISRARQATMSAGGLIMEYAAKTGTIRWIRHVVNQGFSRMENLLYSS